MTTNPEFNISPEVEALLDKHHLWERSDNFHNAAHCLTLDAADELQIVKRALMKRGNTNDVFPSKVERALTLLQDAKRLWAIGEAEFQSYLNRGAAPAASPPDAVTESAPNASE